MDSTTRLQQKKLIKRTQRRLNRLIDLLMKVHLSKRSNHADNDVFQEFVRRSLAKDMFNTGFSSGPFGLTTSSTLETLETASPNATVEPEVEMDLSTVCLDIQGRDRACCNSATRCFDDVRGALDELDSASPGSFSLLTACRKVGSELKRDRLCVQQSLSRCGGPDRGLLQRRFEGRMDTLYDQFYKHCRPSALTTSTTARTPAETVSKVWPTFRTETETPAPTLPGDHGTSGHGGGNFFPPGKPHDHDSHTHAPPLDVSSSSASGAIVAGAITGGIILVLILLVAVFLWCRNRKESNGSNGSMDSRMGIFFQKRPNMFSTDRVRGGNNNNNKPPAMRQDSDVYAEIDEEMVNPGFKPPLPGMSLPGYLNPVSDDDTSSYTPPPTASQPVTTRGQLTYGAILAANQDGCDHVTPYHSTTLTFPEGKQKAEKQSDVPLPPRNLQNETNKDTYRMSELTDSSEDGLDEYEQPVSTGSSLRYATIDNNGPPKTFAPAVPVPAEPQNSSSENSGRKKSGVKVLPSNPFAPFSNSVTASSTSQDSTQPVPQPRKKKEQKLATDKVNVESSTKATPVGVDTTKRTNSCPSNRDSHMSSTSTKSSHHYFVLEPEHNQTDGHIDDYENSVSSPRVV